MIPSHSKPTRLKTRALTKKVKVNFTAILSGLLASLVFTADFEHDVLYLALFVYLLPSTCRPTE
jgi:hypothetical protein